MNQPPVRREPKNGDPLQVHGVWAPSFLDLPEPTSGAMRSIGLDLRYPGHALLFDEGEVAEGVMVLRKGSVKISMSSSRGRALILRIARPHEALALHSVICSKPCQTTAESLEPCEVTFFRRKEFLGFLHEHADAALVAAEQLAETYETACDLFRQIGLAASTPEKLARFLLGWTVDSQPTAQGVRAILNLTHEEIGQMIGASRETVTRALGELRLHRLAALKGATLLIPDRAALASFGNIKRTTA